MSLHLHYSEQIQQHQQALEQTQKKEDRLSLLRLASFIGALLLFYITLEISFGLAMVFLITGLSVFGYVLKRHLDITKRKNHLQNLLTINKKELACIDGDFRYYPDGKEYLDKEHPYTGDLDIFGRSSLFQCINRTTSKPGSNLLAEWLKHPAEVNEIMDRQEAITELKDLISWRQELMAIGYKYSDSLHDPESVVSWASENPLFLKNIFLKIGINICSLLTAGSIIGWMFGFPAGYISVFIAINISIIYKTIADIKKTHRSVSKTSELLKSYEETIVLIEKQHFKSRKLNKLHQKFFTANASAS